MSPCQPSIIRGVVYSEGRRGRGRGIHHEGGGNLEYSRVAIARGEEEGGEEVIRATRGDCFLSL